MYIKSAFPLRYRALAEERLNPFIRRQEWLHVFRLQHTCAC
ncbi:MAG: hypothetical protein ABFS56_19930 [Pseudomonadota bacterium]